jgi:putative ABC transport system ATP-binding protein
MLTNFKNSIAISLKDINKIYDMGPIQVRALDDFTVDIPKGELNVILGPSGSGKTTLLNLIGAIDIPTNGVIHVLGNEITNLSRKELGKFRRDHIGFIFQFFNLIPSLTAIENVEYAIQIQGKKDSHERALEVLKQVGLAERADHFPSELSGGEQQRVAIARALAKSPELILADEPTGELDFETGIKILELLFGLAKSGKSVVIVTHNSEIARIGDRVIRLRSGKVVEVKDNPNPLNPTELRW